MEIKRVIQNEGQFVILAPKVDHGRFNTEYNIAKATDFPNFSWPDTAQVVAENREIESPLM